LAKRLIGQWPHVRPADPEIYVASIAAVLAGYPLGLVQECCDPRHGLARRAEFLTIAAVVEWCDRRLEFHQSVAGYQGRIKATEARMAKYVDAPSDEKQAGLISRMISGVVGLLRADSAGSPLDRLHAERRDSLAMTRKSVLERTVSQEPEPENASPQAP
jgi:hypothetical protein